MIEPMTVVVNAEIEQIQPVLATAIKLGNMASAIVLLEIEWPSSRRVAGVQRGDSHITVDFISWRISTSLSRWRSVSFKRFIKKHAA